MRFLKFLLFSVFVATAIVNAMSAASAQSDPQHCELSLILALDASSSVDPREYDLQQKGLAQALIDPEVIKAIEDLGGVQLMAFEWSGRYHQEIMVGWRFLSSSLDVGRFAADLAAHARVYSEFPTALGYALGFASGQFRVAPLECARKVVDVSGDGENNEGFGPRNAYANFAFAETTVNGLVIKGANPDPERFYRQQVLFGTGAFLEVANGFEDYERAMKQKLLREIGVRQLSQNR